MIIYDAEVNSERQAFLGIKVRSLFVVVLLVEIFPGIGKFKHHMKQRLHTLSRINDRPAGQPRVMDHGSTQWIDWP